MRPLLLLQAIVLTAAAFLPATADAATCSCEHAGSQYDGVCEATTWPAQPTGSETFTWEPWGGAWMPYPTDPSSNAAYYTTRPGHAGGLNVTVTFANGSQQRVSCLGHTGGE